MFRMFWFGLSCFFGYIFITTVGVLYETQGNLTDYLPNMQTLIDNQQLDEALSVSRFVASQRGDLPNTGEILQLGEAIENHQAQYRSSTMQQIYEGFIKGETDTSLETMAAIVSDFIVWGDIRDLGQQSWNHFQGSEVDELVVLLSGIGLAATVATYFPEPASTVSGATVKMTTSLLKSLKRSGSITQPLSRKLIELAKTRQTRELKTFMNTLMAMSKSAPKGTLKTLMRGTKSLKEVKQVALWSKAAPDETVTLLATQGPKGLEFLKKQTRSVSNGLSPNNLPLAMSLPKQALVKQLRRVKTASRISKFIVKDRAYALFSTLSFPALAAISATSLLLLIMSFMNLSHPIRSAPKTTTNKPADE